MKVRVTRPFRCAQTGEELRRGDELDVTAKVARGLIAMRYAEPVDVAPPERPDDQVEVEDRGEGDRRETDAQADGNRNAGAGGKRRRKK